MTYHCELIDARDRNGFPLTLRRCKCGALNAMENDCCYGCGAWIKP